MPQQTSLHEIAVLVMALPSQSACLSAPTAALRFEPASVHEERGPELALYSRAAVPRTAVFGGIDGGALGAAPLWKEVLAGASLDEIDKLDESSISWGGSGHLSCVEVACGMTGALSAGHPMGKLIITWQQTHQMTHM